MNGAAPKTGWAGYWNADFFWRGSAAWEENARIFMGKAARAMRLASSDRVLDFGCGAGHLAERLSPETASVCGLDISEAMIAAASARCSGMNNVSFHRVEPGNFDFSRFGRFDVFIAASVVQYFKSEDEILGLIEGAREAAAPGARFLLTDLPGGPSFLRGDYAAKGLVWAAQLFMKGGEYRKAARHFPVLHFSKESLSRLAEKAGLKAEILKESFSVNGGRLSLLLHFS